MYFIILGALLGVVSVLQETTGTKQKKKKASKIPYLFAGLLGAWLGFCDFANKRK